MSPDQGARDRRAAVVRGIWIAVALAAGGGAAVAAFVAAGGPFVRARRPAATGEVGEVRVFAQTRAGPVQLAPGRLRVLPRPQELVFEVAIDGTGTRDVRIEAELEEERRVLYEERLPAPFERRYLDFRVRLDERVPDRLTLIVVVEPPHRLNLTTRYPIRLEGTRDALRGP